MTSSRAPAHVTDVERAGGPVEGDAPGIAQAHHPELGAQRGGADRRAIERGRAHPRIVGGDEVIRHVHQRGVRGGREVGGALVHVQPQEAGEEILVDALAVVAEIILIALITQRDVEITVVAEMEVAAVVVAVIVVLREERLLGCAEADVGIGGRRFEPRQPLVPGEGSGGVRRQRIEEVEVTVRRVAGMEGDAEQTLLAAGRDAAGDVHEHRAVRRGQVRDHRDAPGAFEDEEAVGFPRRRGHADGRGEREPRKGVAQGVAGDRRRRWHAQGGRRIGVGDGSSHRADEDQIRAGCIILMHFDRQRVGAGDEDAGKLCRAEREVVPVRRVIVGVGNDVAEGGAEDGIGREPDALDQLAVEIKRRVVIKAIGEDQRDRRRRFDHETASEIHGPSSARAAVRRRKRSGGHAQQRRGIRLAAGEPARPGGPVDRRIVIARRRPRNAIQAIRMVVAPRVREIKQYNSGALRRGGRDGGATQQ